MRKKEPDYLYLICEHSVLMNKKLNANDKLVYSLIRGFWNCGLEFTGSNSYIASFLGIHRTSVIRSIQKLEKLQFIRCEYSILNNQDRKIVRYKKITNEINLNDKYADLTTKQLFDLVYNKLKN